VGHRLVELVGAERLTTHAGCQRDCEGDHLMKAGSSDSAAFLHDNPPCCDGGPAHSLAARVGARATPDICGTHWRCPPHKHSMMSARTATAAPCTRWGGRWRRRSGQ